MSTQEFFGLVSGILVFCSAIPYCIGIWQDRNTPQLISWGLWSFIGLVLLLTYKSSGAEDNIWPAVFGFTNPLIITMIALFRRNSEKGHMSIADWFCLGFGILAICIWAIIRDIKELAQIALYVAILADLFAAIPTARFVWKNPGEERPFAWGIYALAYGLALFAVPEVNFSNLALPIYMTTGSSFVALPLVIHRLRNKTPWRGWI